jgi:hypothetical protein
MSQEEARKRWYPVYGLLLLITWLCLLPLPFIVIALIADLFRGHLPSMRDVAFLAAVGLGYVLTLYWPEEPISHDD